METQVRTPQMVFMQPQRLIVPLFQRPYVWNEENQWEPLWTDVIRVAQRLLDDPQGRHQPHFLGAVVLQQSQNPVGTMQERTIIDGQQRLTTLQLLLDALHAELHGVGAEQPAMRIEALVMNARPFWERPEDRFKVWPTNRDRAAFNAVMAVDPPLTYGELQHRDSRLVQAHEYFSQRAREWLQADHQQIQARAGAIERAVRELMHMVVIDLTADENAQEIFETLNARGAQLTAADLIKNFIFQRLNESSVDVEATYERYWKEFETGFWETEISAGRVRHPRSSMFLNHWLIARTGEEILAREVFYRFKRYADFESGMTMLELLGQLHNTAEVYRRFVTAAGQLTGPVDRLGLFAYRTGVLESEVIKPLVLFLLDPNDTAVPPTQVTKALDVMESWMVRRMLVRASTKSYTQVIAELIAHVRKSGRQAAGDLIEDYLRQQAGANWYWPDDDEVRGALRALAAYRRLSRSRLRMTLEAIEDHERGWRGDQIGLGGERVARAKYAIEHIMPRRWQTHWPLTEGQTAAEREALIDTIGNLTLLTGRLNSKVSNGPWIGPEGKRTALHGHDVLLLNRRLLEHDEVWNDDRVRARTDQLIRLILDIWPVPEGHKSQATGTAQTPSRKVELTDLIGAGLLEEGATLHAKRRRVADRTATVLPDGALDVDGVRHETPSGAARAVSGKGEHGWSFWLVDPRSRRSLHDIRQEYIDQREVDADADEPPDEDDED
ncbi:uncharacterized protein with ParB-like and HNH nuclease domain [Couchioplanes caeruleus]|uniref:Uncharacterized protein with ParB-like and HNH nuclease domain n=1 Tax=Couchioplanes caeruleus TaxID=56438 RepID=A0A3N1GS57_9ACTN|nr:uncharacterized protein with ParB-like and HNH nuclease domain [Couchioplanes caeruleus]